MAGIGVTPFGGWVQSLLFGSGARFEDAYVGLETAEANLPRNGRQRERLLLANAQADGDAPIGLSMGARLHPRGTLARLRYETFDERGERMDEWQVRALVPTVGSEAGWGWREECPQACRDELTRSQGTRITRSGEAGMSEEWVLRMPVGQPLELKPTPFQTQDIQDARPYRVLLKSVRVGSQSIQRPSRIRVTLVEACPAEVRMGSAMKFSFNQNATVPIPEGFRVSHWVQLDGCGHLTPYPPRPPEERPAPVKIEIPEPPDLHAIVVRREADTGPSTLRVDESWLIRHGKPVVLQVSAVCRFDAVSDQWQRLPPPSERVTWNLVPVSQEAALLGDRVAFELPKETGLFWVRWSQQQDANRSSRGIVWRDALIASGPIQCNDIQLGRAPEGHIGACLPSVDRAEARFVRQPADVCLN